MKFLMALMAAISFPALLPGEPIVGKDSELWEELYDPPYKDPTELPAGAELRKELFGQLRLKIAALVGGKTARFEGSLKVYKNWAFYSGETIDGDGKPMAIGELENSDTVGLWIRSVDGWRLVDFSAGHSDVFYEVWPEQYGVSKFLLGFSD